MDNFCDKGLVSLIMLSHDDSTYVVAEVFDGMAPDAIDFDDFTRKAGYILIPEYGIYIHKSLFTAYVVPPNVKEGLVCDLSDLKFVRYKGVRA